MDVGRAFAHRFGEDARDELRDGCGFVDRERNEAADRRLVTVALTLSGRAVLDEKRTWVHERQREIFEGLSEAEQGTVIGALSAIAHNIEEL